MQTTGAVIDGVEIAENYGGFGIAGIYLYGGETLWSNSDDCVVRNILIRDNHLKRAVEDVGEPTRGLFIASARVDYFENISIENSVMENLDIYGNTIDGAGIVIDGAYSMLDGNLVMRNNVIRNVNIHDNMILNADYAFIFTGAQMEGRRYDWNFGYPRHAKMWLGP
ncbi:MAG: hypothetical protein LUE87_06650, partial [Lachnospiraceae bacterium]|nr:hypothetical protein [Lachnospiraceae bacterium]